MYLEKDVLPALAGTDQVICTYLSFVNIAFASIFCPHNPADIVWNLNFSYLKARVFQTSNWWSPVKTAASAIYANRHYLGLYRLRHPERLAGSEAYSNGNDTRYFSFQHNYLILIIITKMLILDLMISLI